MLDTADSSLLARMSSGDEGALATLYDRWSDRVHSLAVHLLRDARDAFERVYFEHHIAKEGGNISRVADAVGLERTHLYRKLKQLGIRLNRKVEE